MKKRIVILLLSILLLLNGICVYAEDNRGSIEYELAVPTWTNAIQTTAIANKVNLGIESKAAILMDENTGTILYEENAHEKLRPASVTKVMTLLLTMEALDSGKIKLEDSVPCSEKARKMGGSQIWLNETEELTVHEMLKAICVVSANDCTVAMAEYLAGSEEAFVTMMNERAKELGMNDTTFKNSHGIDEDGHVTSAYDIAIMSRELSKNHPKIHEYTSIWMDSLRDGKSQLVNTNKLIRFYSGATGLKTGSTSLALYNLSATATRNNLKLIGVIMGGATSQKRFDDAKKLLDYGFANFSSVQLAKKGDLIEEIPLLKAKQPSVRVSVKEDVFLLLSKGDEKKIEQEKTMEPNLCAPVKAGDKVGEIRYMLNGEAVALNDIVIDEDVGVKSFFDFMGEGIDYWYTLGREKERIEE